MNRKRMTREDSREQTTQRLLDAARKLISKQGLAASSVEDIAAAAGYSRGAFYSNFSGKHDLFIDILRRDHACTNAEFDELMRDEISLDQIRERTRELYAKLYRNNENFMIWNEARMLGVRDAKFRVKLGELLREKRQRIAGYIEYVFARAGQAPPAPAETLALAFMSLVDGVNMSTLVSPAVMTAATAEAILGLFMDSIMKLDGPALPGA